ncbi:HNH endonuclease [Rhizobium phage RL2RES]|uniref:Nuclease associated modular domain-containing protein n=1 Tax=Rhizobium phage RL2RES TaxID=103371 RepID=A0A6B9J371_9CAUD|nr:HNH endonuclease [Rhizobium phage RL2RES]QGZ14163.1 hypothetical protein RL2RES_136 [Rhizobium phage RL2RES]
MSSEVFWSKRADRSKEFCVYVITYSGDDMPSFYVGHTRVSKMIDMNYHGSVTSRDWSELWHKTVEEDPGKFRRKVLETFETREEAEDREYEILRHFDVASSSLFVNMHRGGRNGFTGCWKGKKRDVSNRAKTRPEEVKRRISETKRLKKDTGYEFAKQTSEAKEKIRNKLKGVPKSEETKAKIRETKRLKRLWDLNHPCRDAFWRDESGGTHQTRYVP